MSLCQISLSVLLIILYEFFSLPATRILSGLKVPSVSMYITPPLKPSDQVGCVAVAYDV
jgi:hypothetical protein